MTTETNKLGRNAPCSCGSGKKYKKCCLDNLFFKATEENSNKQYAFINKFKQQNPNKDITMIRAEEFGMVKMSEIIIDYASELLDAAVSTDDRHKAIIIAVAAWNIALLDGEENENQINKFLRMMQVDKNSEAEKEARNTLRALIYKKQFHYPNIKRFIVNYEFTESTDREGFDLNVMSSIESN